MSYAGVWIRFVAVMLDGLVFVAASFLIGMVGGMSAGDRSAGLGLLLSLMAVLYTLVMETAYGGTIGKQLAGLRVVNSGGHRITLGQSFVRNLLRLVDGLFVYLVGAVFIWSSPMRQRLGDRAASTFVVRASSVRGAARPQSSPSIPTLPAATRATHAAQSTVWEEFRN
jgi:uncharacterized RDD family membrane protein YckC